MAIAKYTGTFGGNSAGTDGRSTTMTGPILSSNIVINSVSFEINMSSGGYSSSKDWVVHWLRANTGSPYAPYSADPMSGYKYPQKVSGPMYYSQSDISTLSGGFTLEAKVNTTHSSTSYMWDVTITVDYRVKTPPTGVTCSLGSSYLKAGQSTTLSWTTSGGTPTGYYAYKNGSGTPFYSGTNAYTSVTANSTVNGSDYYTVRAYNNDGYADSSAVRLYTYKDPTVDSITLTPSTAGYGKDVSVAWTATNGGTYNAISSYTIQINNVNVKTGQSSSPCTITAPLTGASATIKVIAVGTRTNSTGSRTATLTLKANNSIIYRSNGTTYVQEMIYRSDGTSWVPLFVYRSNGTNWIKMG